MIEYTASLIIGLGAYLYGGITPFWAAAVLTRRAWRMARNETEAR